MTFIVYSTSTRHIMQMTKTFNSLEELQEFSLSCGKQIIVNFQDMTIEVYDNYRE